MSEDGEKEDMDVEKTEEDTEDEYSSATTKMTLPLKQQHEI